MHFELYFLFFGGVGRGAGWEVKRTPDTSRLQASVCSDPVPSAGSVRSVSPRGEKAIRTMNFERFFVLFFCPLKTQSIE